MDLPWRSFKLTVVRPSVRLLPAFLEIGSLFFADFWRKDAKWQCPKCDGARFSKKKIFWANLVQKPLKNRVFWTLCKIASLVFSNFWQKNRGQCVLKNSRNNFSRKIFFRRKLQICVFWGNSLLPLACSFDYSCYKTISHIFLEFWWPFVYYFSVPISFLNLLFHSHPFSFYIYHQVGPLCIVLVYFIFIKKLKKI